MHLRNLEVLNEMKLIYPVADLDHFDENEELMGWETAPGEDAYALSRTPMGAILKLQAEANATHKCPIKRYT